MKFREINEAIYSLVDQETGEISDLEALEALEMMFTEKVQNVALWVLDLNDDIDNLDKEISRLTDMKKKTENRIKSLKNLLLAVTGGQKVKTDLVSVSFRKTEAVKIDDDSAVISWAEKNGRDSDLLKYSNPTVSKTELKKLLKSGVEVPCARIEENISTVIK